MKGHLLPDVILPGVSNVESGDRHGNKGKEERIGMDIHRRFSQVTARDNQQQIVWRRRLAQRHPHLPAWKATSPPPHYAST